MYRVNGTITLIVNVNMQVPSNKGDKQPKTLVEAHKAATQVLDESLAIIEQNLACSTQTNIDPIGRVLSLDVQASCPVVRKIIKVIPKGES